MRQIEAINQTIEPLVTSLGYELVGVQLLQAKTKVLRIYLDTLPDIRESITLDQCAQVSREVAAILDVEDVVDGHYILEVSSPGVDRYLFKLTDYQRFVGEEVTLQLSVPHEGTRKLKGTILGINAKNVLIEVKSKKLKTEQLSIDFDQIDRAQLKGKIEPKGKVEVAK